MPVPPLPGFPSEFIVGQTITPAFLDWLNKLLLAVNTGGGSGTVTNIATTAPITGGPITTTGTIGVTDMVASGVGHARGTAPDPGAVAGTTKFLREDATWQVPAGGGGAPVGASYVVMALDATLTNERNAVATAPIVLTDSGANAPATWSITDFGASGGGHGRGSVVDTPAVAGVIKFLCEDATWKIPQSANSQGGFDYGKSIATVAARLGY